MDLELPQEFFKMKEFDDAQSEDEKEQLLWMLSHPIIDKDAQENRGENFSPIQRRAQKKGRRPEAWNFPLPDLEVDLHGLTADEAEVKLEETFAAMEKSGYSILRIIHGGGNPLYGNIKKRIDRKVRTEWKRKILFFKIEPDNAGSSIIQIAPGKNSFSKNSPAKIPGFRLQKRKKS